MDKELFNRIVSGLNEAVDHARGKITLKTTRVAIPGKPESFSPAQIKGLRESMGLSQGVFARFLNVSRETAISWEQGRRTPSGSALRLLEICSRNPDLLVKSLC